MLFDEDWRVRGSVDRWEAGGGAGALGDGSGHQYNAGRGSEVGGRRHLELVGRRPDAVLGVATGSSPLIIYDELGRRVAQGSFSLAKARAFMLDEYVGLPADHPQRYRNVIREEFVDKVDIDPAQVFGPDGLAADLASACEAYERAIADAPAASTYEFLGSARTGISHSTNPAPRSPLEPGSRR